MRRNPVLVAWAAGLLLAATVYVVGPEHLVFRILDNLHYAGWWLGEVVARLGGVTAEAVRALAIGIYVTFVALGAAVEQRGGHAKGALFWVSVGFWLLAGGVIGFDEGYGRWAMALVLVIIAALSMTARLRQVRSPV